ncbi:PucR family transcriptional regulator [Niallia sp. 03133]|uniref:PucR family transcriptional regulator n=1 Tax=Niallia sp. 03133 TaxID=3458060 RepID=UPI0040447245
MTLRKIANLPECKTITLVAGGEGIDRAITGVNVTESGELAEFFRPNELIVTTGINMAKDQKKLSEIVEIAFRRKAAGIVLNTGPYIPFIPEQILQFANQHHFPVFQMPWDYRIADFLKLVVQFLDREHTVQTKKEYILSDILFNSESQQERITQEILGLGYKRDAEFSTIVCEINTPNVSIHSLVQTIEEWFHKRYKSFLSMVYENQLIYMIEHSDFHTSKIPFSKAIKCLYTDVSMKRNEAKLVIGTGNFYKNVTELSKSFNEAKTVIHLSKRNPNQLFYHYKDIGAYKLLIGLQDRNLIESYHQEMLGLLYRYDQLNETDYVSFLRIYLEEDGHTSNIGRREFIHRNTVLYKLKKIESILNIDLSNSLTKTNILLAFMIEDILI